MTLCPALRAMVESEVPNPEEQPVMSQTRDFEVDGIVYFVVCSSFYGICEYLECVTERNLYT